MSDSIPGRFHSRISRPGGPGPPHNWAAPLTDTKLTAAPNRESALRPSCHSPPTIKVHGGAGGRPRPCWAGQETETWRMHCRRRTSRAGLKSDLKSEAGAANPAPSAPLGRPAAEESPKPSRGSPRDSGFQNRPALGPSPRARAQSRGRAADCISQQVPRRRPRGATNWAGGYLPSLPEMPRRPQGRVGPSLASPE